MCTTFSLSITLALVKWQRSLVAAAEVFLALERRVLIIFPPKPLSAGAPRADLPNCPIRAFGLRGLGACLVIRCDALRNSRLIDLGSGLGCRVGEKKQKILRVNGTYAIKDKDAGIAFSPAMISRAKWLF